IETGAAEERVASAVIEEAVGYAETERAHGRSRAAREELEHRVTETAGQRRLLERDHASRASSPVSNEALVERLREAGVDDGRVDALLEEKLSGRAGAGDHRSIGDEHQIAARLDQLRFSDRNRARLGVERHAEAASTWIAHRDRPSLVGGHGGQHVP